MKEKRELSLAGILLLIVFFAISFSGKNVWAEMTGKNIKKIALTFDDGPHRIYTEKLLDGLKQREVKATFFVIGNQIEGNEDLLARMKKEGHLIGNHTFDHVNLACLSQEEGLRQIEKTNQLITEITGEEVNFIRPPFGSWNQLLEERVKMIPILWNVDPLDWKTKDASIISKRVLEEVEENDIILLHDFYDTSVDAALIIVDELKKQGYSFVTADEIVMD